MIPNRLDFIAARKVVRAPSEENAQHRNRIRDVEPAVLIDVSDPLQTALAIA